MEEHASIVSEWRRLAKRRYGELGMRAWIGLGATNVSSGSPLGLSRMAPRKVDLDARAPTENARELMRHLPNAELFVAPGYGHGLLPRPDVIADKSPSSLRGITSPFAT